MDYWHHKVLYISTRSLILFVPSHLSPFNTMVLRPSEINRSCAPINLHNSPPPIWIVSHTVPKLLTNYRSKREKLDLNPKLVA